MNNKITYPEEWNDLPKYERKKKIKALKTQQVETANSRKKILKITLIIVFIILAVYGYKKSTTKSPEQIKFEQQVDETSLEGKVEEFIIEGRTHVASGTKVDYKTNPPTSGAHFGQAKSWGVYSKEIDDKATIHGLEHGGIWISYKDIDDEMIKTLEEIGKQNPLSVIVSPRSANDARISIVSWGRMMKLDTADKTLIQKYIDEYKNQSPEKLAS